MKKFYNIGMAAILGASLVLAGCNAAGTGGLASDSLTGAEIQAADLNDTTYNYSGGIEGMGLAGIEEMAEELLRRLDEEDTVNQVDMIELEKRMTDYNNTVAMMSDMLRSLGDTDKEVIRAMSVENVIADEEAAANLQPFGNATTFAVSGENVILDEEAMPERQLDIGGYNSLVEQTSKLLDMLKKLEGATTFEAESADFQKDWNNTLNKVGGLLKEILEAQNQANSAIYRNP